MERHRNMVNMKAKAKPIIRKNERIRMEDIHSTDGSDSENESEPSPELENKTNGKKGSSDKHKSPQKRSLNHVDLRKGSSSSPLKNQKNFTSSTSPPLTLSDDESSSIDKIEKVVNRSKRNGVATATPSPLDSLADEVEERQRKAQSKRKAKNTSNRKSRKKSVAKGKKKVEEESEEEESEIEGDYVPEKIVAHKWLKKDGGKITQYQYKVRWEGYGEEDDTWEPEYHLSQTPKLITEYWEGKQKKSSKTKTKKQGSTTSQNQRKLDLVSESGEDEESDSQTKEASTSKTKFASKSIVQKTGNGKKNKREGGKEEEEEEKEEEEEMKDEEMAEENSESDEDEDEDEEEDEDEIELQRRNQVLLKKYKKIGKWDEGILEVVQMREKDDCREVKIVFKSSDQLWCPLDLAEDRAAKSLLKFYRARTQIKKPD